MVAPLPYAFFPIDHSEPHTLLQAPKFTLAVLVLVAFAQATPIANRIPEVSFPGVLSCRTFCGWQTELVQGKSDLRTQAVNAIALLQSQGTPPVFLVKNNVPPSSTVLITLR